MLTMLCLCDRVFSYISISMLNVLQFAEGNVRKSIALKHFNAQKSLS